MYVKQALGASIASDQLGQPSGGTAVTFTGGTGTAKEPSTGDKIKDVLKGAFGFAVDTYNTGQQQKGQLSVYQADAAQAQPVSTTPSWLVPALIGGGVLVAVIILKKK